MRTFINALSVFTMLLVCVTFSYVWGASTGNVLESSKEIAAIPIAKKTVVVFKKDTTISHIWIVTTYYKVD